MTPSTRVCCYCDTQLTCEGCGREQPDTPSTPALTDAGALAATRQTAADAIRTFCKSLGAGSVAISSDGVERIYYAGISLDALSVAVAMALRNSAPQETRGDELRAALEPFAKAAPCAEITDLRDGEVVWRDRNPAGGYSVLTKDDFRRAAKAFAAPQQSPRLERDEILRGLAEFFSESVHHVWSNDEIADCLTGMIDHAAVPSTSRGEVGK